jgi:hypothetical protein
MITAPTPPQTNVANMVIRNMPIRQRIDWLMDHAHRHSAEYQSSEFYQARSLYIAQHPTSIVALNCMDGRVNISVATDTPMGIILPFRNLGGRFSLGWPYFGEVLAGQMRHMIGQGRRTLVLITYHYSKGDSHSPLSPPQLRISCPHWRGSTRACLSRCGKISCRSCRATSLTADKTHRAIRTEHLCSVGNFHCSWVQPVPR